MVSSVPRSADMCARSGEQLSQSVAGKRNPDPTALKHPLAQVDATVIPTLESEKLPQSPLSKCSLAAMSNTLERPEALSVDILSPLQSFEEIEIEEAFSLMDSELIASPPVIRKFAHGMSKPKVRAKWRESYGSIFATSVMVHAPAITLTLPPFMPSMSRFFSVVVR